MKKCEDFAVTIVCNSVEADTRVNSEEVLSDEDFLAVFGARDIRQVIRRCARPPGGPTRRTAWLDSRQEPSAPAVDLVTGKCRPGRVSRTVSTSPLMLDLTVMCTPDTEILQPGAAAQGVPPPGTMTNTVAGFDTSTPVVATLVPVVGQPDPKAKELPTLRLSESSDLLPSFGLSSSSSSPTLPWGSAEDSSPSFSPTGCVRGTLRMFRARVVCLMCHRFHQNSSFGLLGRAEQPRLRGVLLPYCPVVAGEDRLLETGLPGCPYRFLESGKLPFTDGNPAYGLQLHHPRFLELVGAPESARLPDCSPSFWEEHLGKEQAMAAAINLQRDVGVMLSNLQILSQFAMAMNRMSFSLMALGLARSLFPRVEVDDLAPAPRAVRAASYMSAMGLWHPQKNPDVPGPVLIQE